MKRAALIGMMAILAYSQAGYYFVMRTSQYRQKQMIKGRILRSLNRDELEVISLEDNRHDIHWEQNGTEFFLRGELYDVVERKTVKGKVLLYCINDKKEKELINKYNLITKHNSSGKKGKHTSVSPIKLFINTTGSESSFYSLKETNTFASFNSRVQSIVIPVDSPPPQA